MQLRQPRRIFRSAGLPRHALLIAAALSGVALLLIVAPWQMFGSAASRAKPEVPQLVAPPSQVAVVDGGTLKVDDQVVRLLGVDPPAWGETCHSRTGYAVDCGTAAANALAAIVRDAPVRCQLSSQDGRGRVFGRCEVAGNDINDAIVAAGWARAGAGVPTLSAREAAARAARAGLWADGEATR